MAAVSDLARLFRAVGTGELETAKRVADDIALGEERLGRAGAAQRLRGALRPNGKRVGGVPAEIPGVALTYDGLLPCATDRELDDIVLRPANRKQLEEIVQEVQVESELARVGLARRSRLLFHGPPGCGKSLTAKALARHLRLPAYIVKFDAIVGAFLGQTAARLRQLFEFIARVPSVVIMDEIDALGRRRGDPQDVGELDRIVIALLQELEHAQVAGLLVATTNAAERLDRALWRRFDLTLGFPRPGRSTVIAYARRRSTAWNLQVPSGLRKALGGADSFAAIDALLAQHARRRLLESLRAK